MSRRGIAALSALLLTLLTACDAGGSGPSSEPETSVVAARAPEDALSVVDPELMSSIPGFQTRSRVDEERQMHATWPDLPGMAALDAAVEDHAEARIDDFLTEYLPTPGAVAVPELNLTWRTVGMSEEVVGIVQDEYLNPGGSAAMLWRSTWYDVAAGEVVDNSALISDPDALTRTIRKALIDLAGADFSDGIDEALAEEPPVVGFTGDGSLFVGFDEGQVAAASEGRISVRIPADRTEGLLTQIGLEARAAALDPVVPTGGATDLPGDEPSDEPSSEPSEEPGPAKPDCDRLKCVALTFDDGPGGFTDGLLDLLRRKDATATFFVLGQQVESYPDVARRIVADGHEIGIHTWDHKSLPTLSPAKVQWEILSTQRAIEQATGQRARLLRPPYGAVDGVVDRVARRAGLAEMFWSVDPEDWKDHDSAVVARRVLAKARAGSVILVHDIHRTTVDAIGGIVAGLRQRGFTLVRASDLFGDLKAGKRYYSR